MEAPVPEPEATRSRLPNRFGRGVAFVAIALFGVAAATALWPTSDPDPAAAPKFELSEPPPLIRERPQLEAIDEWLQTDIRSLDELHGQVHVVQFWTFGCYNCRNTISFLQDLNANYGDEITIVGVHSPEFERERDIGNVAEAAVELGVTWPIAIDNDQKNFFGWQGRTGYWPRIYVVDHTGQIRLDRRGEGGYDEIEATVAYLLDEQAAAAAAEA